LKRQIIFIPGIMGSVLKEKKGATIWPRLLPPLGFYEKKLSMDKHIDLSATELVSSVYHFIEGELELCAEEFTIFPYDWRKNNYDQVALLEAEIDQTADEIIIIAHSMGGIIAKMFLNEYKNASFYSKIKKIITLGTPWFGAMEAYKTLVYGKSIPKWLGLVLREEDSKKIAPSFPSIYQLLPHPKYFSEIGKYEDISVLLDIENKYDDWESFYEDKVKQFFSKYKHKYSEIIDEYRYILERPIDIEHHEIIGFGCETIAGLFENEKDDIHAHFRNGDGTVPLFSAMSETDYKYFIYKSEHDDLPKDMEVIEIIKYILSDLPVEGNERVYLDYEEVLEKGFEANILKIACPVMVSIIDEMGRPLYGLSDSIDIETLQYLNKEKINVHSIGNTVYIVMDPNKPEDSIGKVIIEAFDRGPTSVSMEKYRRGQLFSVNSFKSFDIDPSITAELSIIDGEIFENNLILKTEGEIKSVETAEYTEIKDEKLINPEISEYSIQSDDIIEYEDIYIVSSDISLTVEAVRDGTYKTDNQFYILNDEIISIQLLEPQGIILEEGYNEIKIFATDILGNTEDNPTIIKVFKVPAEFYNIHFAFYPHLYSINIEEKSIISQLFTLTNIQRPKYDLIIEDLQGVTGNNIIYSEKTRKVIIRLYSIFEEVDPLEKEFYIYENEILSVFEGISKIETFNQFLNGLKMLFPDFIKMTKKEGRGIYSKVTESNISNSRHFFFSTDNVILEIFRNVKYKISFQNLMEDIDTDEKQEYIFHFKVFSLETGKELKSENINYFVRFNIGKEEFITQESKADYSKEHGSYLGKINIDTIKEISSKFWNENSFYDIELIIADEENGNVLRSQRITVR
jgi:hypothetical protein